MQLSGLAGRLVADGLLDAELAQTAQKESARDKVPFVSYVVEKDYIDGQALAEMASEEFGVPLFDITAFNKQRFDYSCTAFLTC
jgi:type IV pilus assembly protein PilB